jgi:hypothetical protein
VSLTQTLVKKICQSTLKTNLRQKRVICVPSDLKKHEGMVKNAEKYLAFLDKLIRKSPELFPPSD